MDSSLAIQNSPHHARSISLPSRSHLPFHRVEEQLCRLRSSELATTSSSLICYNLVLLQDLYESLDDLIQQSISREKQVDQVLDGSLKLLDVCGIMKEIMSQMKQSVQDLQSSLRRRVAESDVANEACAYMTLRKKGNKLIQKCIGDIKKLDVKSSPINKESNLVTILSEVELITVAVFGSLLCFASGAKATSEKNSWSLISKLKRTRSATCKEEGKHTSEMVKADALLKTLIHQKSCKNSKDAQKSLKTLATSLQDLEDGLECLFRHMIKARVSLLNIHNQY